jgi:hypothetical protein
MADENPTGRGSAVVLSIPADQACFLRSTFKSAQVGIRDELREYPKQLKEPARLRREEAAYGRLLELVIVPDQDVLDVLGDLSGIIDQGNEYRRVVTEHEALNGLLAQLCG